MQRHRLRHGRTAHAGKRRGLLRPRIGGSLRDRGYSTGICTCGSCVDNSRLLLAATEVVKAGGLGNDICDVPVAGSAPEWMSEKAISIGHYVVSSGIYTVFGAAFPTIRCARFQELPVQGNGKGLRRHVGFRNRIPSTTPMLMIDHIDKKRKALGIDKARERVLMDMADRQALEA